MFRELGSLQTKNPSDDQTWELVLTSGLLCRKDYQSWRFEPTDASYFLTTWYAGLWTASWDITKTKHFHILKTKSEVAVKAESFCQLLCHPWAPLGFPPSGFSPGRTAAEIFNIFIPFLWFLFLQGKTDRRRKEMWECVRVSIKMLKEGTVGAFSGLWKCDEWSLCRKQLLLFYQWTGNWLLCCCSLLHLLWHFLYYFIFSFSLSLCLFPFPFSSFCFSLTPFSFPLPFFFFLIHII